MKKKKKVFENLNIVYEKEGVRLIAKDYENYLKVLKEFEYSFSIDEIVFYREFALNSVKKNAPELLKMFINSQKQMEINNKVIFD